MRLSVGNRKDDVNKYLSCCAAKGGGGARINDKVVTDENVMLSLDDVNADGVIKLSAGKKRHALVKPV